MRLYRHYKNKLYRFVETVKHSETLEDLVLYEALYDNPQGKLWVRPKTMFLGSVEHDGLYQRRFAELNFTIVPHESWNPTLYADLEDLGRRCFADWNTKVFAERPGRFPQILALLGYVEGSLIGFKIGYREGDKTFYSWLGAVLPEYQRAGIGSELMTHQHAWAARQGFNRVRTKCLNFNQAMLTLNIKHGFRVVAVESTEAGPKLILEKSLGHSWC